MAWIDDLVFPLSSAAGFSSDANYNGLNPADVSVTNTDNDVAGFTLTPTSGLATTEAGQAATFTVKLTSRPTASVTLDLAPNDATEGTVAPASLTFNTANWNVAQTVAVTGVDDAELDGNVAYAIVTAPVTSSDANYGGLNPADVSVTNFDNEGAGLTFSPAGGLVTTEAGGTAAFTVKLNTRPSAGVTIGLSSSDTTEGTVSPASLTFTAANWSTTQAVTVTGVDDVQLDGSVAFTIVTAPATSADPSYDGLDSADLSASNTDNDVAGFTVTPTSGLVTTEAGGTATFSVALTVAPMGQVTFGLASGDATEGHRGTGES